VLLVLLAYVAAAVLAHPHWVQVARHSVLPAFHWSRAYVEGALALLGTTLTSYVYVWQTVEIAEEKPPRPRLKLEQAGAAAGIAFAVLLFWFILVATGATLGVHHARVATPEDAARALQPVAGRFASDLFGIGLLSSALVALPVVLGTIGYVVGARFGWRRGLSAPVKRAPRFYAVVLITMAAGAGIGLAGVSPIRLLFLASVAGGLATPIGLAYLLLVARDRYLMGEDAVSGWLELTGWAVAVVITGLSLVYLALQLLSW
jgi:Mn2+/Fe2+ NRAMP family transporter